MAREVSSLLGTLQEGPVAFPSLTRGLKMGLEILDSTNNLAELPNVGVIGEE